MTLLTLRLLLRSKRWVAPLLLVTAVSAAVLSTPGPALDNLTVALVLLSAHGIWIAVACGNIDDDPHRDLAACRAGSTARLHAIRSAAAAVWSLGLGAPVVLIYCVAASHPAHQPTLAAVTAAAVATDVLGALIGVTVGSLLHRPLMRNTAVAVLAGVASLVVLVYLPPVTHVLRSYAHGRINGLPALLAEALALTLASIAAGARLSARRR